MSLVRVLVLVTLHDCAVQLSTVVTQKRKELLQRKLHAVLNFCSQRKDLSAGPAARPKHDACIDPVLRVRHTSVL